MPNIGRVTVGSTTNQKTIRIRQQTQTTIASPIYNPEIDLYLRDLKDVSIINPQDGFTLSYNSSNEKFEAKELVVQDIQGGTFWNA